MPLFVFSEGVMEGLGEPGIPGPLWQGFFLSLVLLTFWAT